MVILIRFILFALFIFLIFRLIKYLLNPKRKLELAFDQKRFYFLDDKENVRKNFLLTYKGALFEGEKYLGTTSESFEVISIFIWSKTPDKLKGLTKNDLLFLEKEIKKAYPYAKIDWKSPMKELLQKGDENSINV
jgi:hypothetical protein